MALSRTPSNLHSVVNISTQFTARSTAYLSKLPHPIEPLEELISVVAVKSSLVSSLQSQIDRFSHLDFSPVYSFLNPLCQDIIFAISQLNSRVEDAQRSKVFQPNDVGLVRLPRNGWILINGSEAKAASLRSRLYVEKYRVRVLIDAVTWYGLRSLDSRTPEQELEYQGLRSRLGLVAERLVGVWRDYAPRLRVLESGQSVQNPFVDPTEVERQRSVQRAMQMQMQAAMTNQAQPQQQAQNQPPMYEAAMEQSRRLQRQQETAAQQGIQTPATNHISAFNDEKYDLKRRTSCSSCTSSGTIESDQDTKYETYLLRRNPATRILKSSTKLFFLPWSISKKHTHTPASHYIKPLPSSASEISFYKLQSQANLSPAQHITAIQKKILKMSDDAQWEIQKLCEMRDNATSERNVRRNWEVVGLVERERRRISHSSVKRGWWRVWKGKGKRDRRDGVEWVLVLRGETVDKEERVTPGKNDNPWKREEKNVGPEQTQQAQAMAQQQAQIRAQQMQMQMQMQSQCQIQNPASVLRHVEQRRTMSVDEAERRMDEMLKDLFEFQDPDSDDEDEDEDEDDEEEEEGYEEKGKKAEEMDYCSPENKFQSREGRCR